MKYIVSPPDKGDLGGFFYKIFLFKNTLKLSMKRTILNLPSTYLRSRNVERFDA